MLKAVSVSEFIEQINGIVAGEFVVEGEVSQYKISQGKWIFFDLKDDTATLNCFSTVFMLRTPLEEGMKVRITGYPSIHAKSGRFSFTVQAVEMVGEGSLKRAYELLKAKLTNEGLFDPLRKRELPRLPERIGVIASRDSAAFGDFKRILNNRWGGVKVVLRHVAVQGEMAVADIVTAFREFNDYDGPFDVLVLIRGGGSLEDLAAFNSEEVVRAVYGSKIPVVCGVGHERDESLADLAADVRASTPSNAAEMVVPDRKEFIKELDFELEQCMAQLEHTTTTVGHSLDEQLLLIVGQLEEPLQEVRSLFGMLPKMFTQLGARLKVHQDLLTSSSTLFKNVDPKRVLKRGFSITRDKQGNIVRRAMSVDKGETIVVELAHGSLEGTITHKQ